MFYKIKTKSRFYNKTARKYFNNATFMFKITHNACLRLDKEIKIQNEWVPKSLNASRAYIRPKLIQNFTNHKTRKS